ncbi:protein YIPF1 [Tanacetum coccineum]
MAESSSYTSLPTSHLPGSVPAVITEEKASAIQKDPEANLQIFPPNTGAAGGGGGGGGGGRGYQTLTSPSDGNGQQSGNNWNGTFSISSYTQYFNVDTDDVVNRLTSSLYPTGDFFRKIEANPDLYGLIWISTTLVFVIASLGNCATYLMSKKGNSSVSWSFDVSYFQVSAIAVYGYVFIVPLGFYLLLQYFGSRVGGLVHFWCMWGYSLFIFILSSVSLHLACLSYLNQKSEPPISALQHTLLVIPVDFIRWTITLITGITSAAFVGLNLKSRVELNDLTIVLVAACVMQFALAIFIKSWGKTITSYIAGELTKRPQTVVFLEHIDKANASGREIGEFEILVPKVKKIKSCFDLNLPLDEAEESESDTVSDTKDVWLEEFLQQMDEKVRSGLIACLMEAREKQGGVSGTMVKLAAVQGVTIEEDDALCSCLPSRIIIGCSRRYD